MLLCIRYSLYMSNGIIYNGIIYVVRNVQSNKEFVGSTTLSLSRIWSAHISWTLHGRDSPLHDDMRKLGQSNFQIKHLESVPINLLREKQLWWVDALNSGIPNGYNRNTWNSGRQVHLTAKDVRQILKLSKTIPQGTIAQTFGVSQPTISRIITRKIYK
jgi:hypothetical protein